MKIEDLIKEGREIKTCCVEEGAFGFDYVTGEKYAIWIENSKLYFETELSNLDIKKRFDELAENAYDKGVEYHTKMMAILIAVKENTENFKQLKTKDTNNIPIDKIFISHCSKDKRYIKLFVQLLNDIGVQRSNEKIFCSSFEGYNIPIGESIYKYIKEQFNYNVLVIFMLSKNYYKSAACLNEMGATWVKSKDYRSILLPGFDFYDVDGAIDTTKISFKINEKERLNSFKEQIIEKFKLDKLDGSLWEESRDKFLTGVDKLIVEDKIENSEIEINVEKIKGKSSKEHIELTLRFKNESNSIIEFSEIDIELKDKNGKKINIILEDEIEDFKLHSNENRVETYTIQNFDKEYNPNRNDESKIKFFTA